VCLDCSEYMRNGDFNPTRFEAQKEAAALIWQSKLGGHPETAVGLMSMGLGGKAQIVRSCTTEAGELQSVTSKLSMKGESNFLIGLHTAQLALKHRINKNAAQRIVMFVGSPIQGKKKQIIQAAKKLKKNKVSVDIINFGEHKDNTTLLEDFYKHVNQGDSCNLLNVERGAKLGNVVQTSPIILGAQEPVPQAAQNVGGDLGGAIDPNMDPELAMAIRISLEESKQREERQAQQAQQASLANGDAAQPAADGAPPAPQAAEPAAPAADAMEEDDDEDDEEALLAQAIQMSMEAENAASTPAEPKKEEVNDQQIMEQLIKELPGIDPDNIGLDDLLDAVSDDDDEEDKNPKDDKAKKDDKK